MSTSLRYNIEPWKPDQHARKGFTSGLAMVDNFLQRTARKRQQADMTRLWVALAHDDQRLLGYYALNAVSLPAIGAPAVLTRRTPPHGLPGIFLSVLGVNTVLQGHGIGRALLAHAHAIIADAATRIGIAVSLLDCVNDGDQEAWLRRQKFYTDRGYQPLDSTPGRMWRRVTPTVNQPAADHPSAADHPA